MYLHIFLVAISVNYLIPERTYASEIQDHTFEIEQNPSNQIHVSEVALHRRKRWDHNSHTVRENLKNREKINTFVSSHHAGDVIYTIEGEGANSIFQINNITGEFFVVEPLDRENKSTYHLSIFAKDVQGKNVEDPANETINVGDENDNAPEFPPGQNRATVPERSAVGTLVTKITAIDKDDPLYPGGELEYSLVYPNRSKFTIDSKCGEVKTAASDLDYENVRAYEIVIQVRDAPGSVFFYSATTTLTINLIDVNDNVPEFTELQYKKRIPENTAPGAGILYIEVTDKDQNINALTKFSILNSRDGSNFEIDTINNTGVLKVKELLDYETTLNHSYRFIVEARNVIEDPHIGPMFGIASVTIQMTDVNEAPEFKPPNYRFSVRENCRIGAFIGKVSAVDPEGDPYRYWISNKSNQFTIDSESGNISVTGELDREIKERYELLVAAGSQDLFATVEVIIDVTDVNDNPPIPLDENSLNLIVCENSRSKTQVLQPNIRMKDQDTRINSFPFHYFPLKHQAYETDFKLVDNKDNTATLHTLHSNFDIHDGELYKVPFLIRDSGQPSMNATYVLEVRVCYCINGSPSCDKALHTTGIDAVALVVILGVCLLLLTIVIVLVVVRRRQRVEDPLIKRSTTSLVEDVRESFIAYREEGGEEDTNAFDLGVLQGDSTTSNSSRSHESFYPNVKYFPPRNKPLFRDPDPYYRSHRPDVIDPNIRHSIDRKRTNEDNDDRTLAFDSIQIYTYEGDDSCAGSLSSLCSSSDNSDQDYDHLKEWGPRFKRLANMYGTY